jgi:hypothetical protein
MFKAAYDSVWLIPVSAWVAAAVAVWIASHRGGFARVYGVVFAVASALDAWLGGPFTPLAAGGGIAAASGVFFVVVGDLRFFVAYERLERGAAARRWVPFGLALVVPVASELLRRGIPAIAASERVTYLAYELLFLPVAAAFLFHARGRSRAMSRLALFELGQYALWALADAVILATGSDLGYLLRIVPNALYYVVFLPFALSTLPRAE